MKLTTLKKSLSMPFAALAVFALSLPAAVAPSAHAADRACVYLKSGVGYAAKMQIYAGKYSVWSGSFSAFQSKCISLKRIVVGERFYVQVKALGGKTKMCGSLIHNGGEGSIVFLASGTTLKVHCWMPR